MEALIRQAELKDANGIAKIHVRNREAQINFPIYYKHIPREQNKKADAYVNSALDTSTDNML